MTPQQEWAARRFEPFDYPHETAAEMRPFDLRGRLRLPRRIDFDEPVKVGGQRVAERARLIA